MKREASCSCGALKAICTGEPELVSLCHCVECQKRTSAPFGIAAFFLQKNVKVIGDYKCYRRTSDSGFDVAFHFCGICGSTVFWKPSRKPGFVAIGTGSFGDKHFPKPSQEVHVECRHDWVDPL